MKSLFVYSSRSLAARTISKKRDVQRRRHKMITFDSGELGLMVPFVLPCSVEFGGPGRIAPVDRRVLDQLPRCQ